MEITKMIKNEITAEEIRNKCAPFKEKVIKRIEERAQQRHEFAMEYIYKIVDENAISHIAKGAITIIYPTSFFKTMMRLSLTKASP